MTGGALSIETAMPSHPEARQLIIELNAFLDGLYRPDDNHFSLDDSEVSDERGVFLLARLGAEPVGCGAVRMIEPGRGELKRMYVRPAVRGSGVGRALLDRLEREARSRGATELVLEMGAHQPEALSLYETSGFRPVPCWGEYLATPVSICLGKALTTT